MNPLTREDVQTLFSLLHNGGLRPRQGTDPAQMLDLYWQLFSDDGLTLEELLEAGRQFLRGRTLTDKGTFERPAEHDRSTEFWPAPAALLCRVRWLDESHAAWRKVMHTEERLWDHLTAACVHASGPEDYDGSEFRRLYRAMRQSWVDTPRDERVQLVDTAGGRKLICFGDELAKRLPRQIEVNDADAP